MKMPTSLFRRNNLPRKSKSQTSVRWLLRLDRLDDRISPTVSSISASFNNRHIGVGSTVWFNSTLNVNGLGNAPVTIHMTDAAVDSGYFHVDMPDAAVTFSPTATSASTTFDSGLNTWVTVIPSSLRKSAFLDGGSFYAWSALPGGINPVTFSANFTTDTPGVTLKWQWAAAVYSSFSSDYNALGVKPIDGRKANPYHNKDDAGTPENYKSYLVRGARGQGGNNYTGNRTSQVTVHPEYLPLVNTGSLSGYLYVDSSREGFFDPGEEPLSGRIVELTGIDVNGGMVALQTQTNAAGFYQFLNLAPGTYALHVLPDSVYNGVPNASPGTIGGDNSTSYYTTGIQIGSGDEGSQYNFGYYSDFN